MKTAVTLLVTSTALFRTRAPRVQTLAIFPHRRTPPGVPAGSPEGQPGTSQPGQTEGPQRGGRDHPPGAHAESRARPNPREQDLPYNERKQDRVLPQKTRAPGKEPPTTQDGVPDTDRSHPSHKSGRHRRRSRNRRRGGTEGRRDPVRPRARPEPAFSNTFNNTGRRGHCGSPGTSRRRHGKGQNRRTGTLPRESHAEDAREGGAPRRNPGRTRGGHADRLAADPLTGKSPPLSHTSCRPGSSTPAEPASAASL